MSRVPDSSVYPDREPPRVLTTLDEKAEYLQRVIGAFDRGIPPDEATLRLFSGWNEVFDRFAFRGSPAYHALRSFFGWKAVPRERFFSEPTYLKLDRREGRIDGFEDRV